MASVKNTFYFRVNGFPSVTNWNTDELFHDSYAEPQAISPIDTFILKNRSLNVLVVDPTGALKEIERRIADNEIDVNQGQSLLAHLSGPGSLDSTFANLLLLGNVSAVESYLREIIRKLINIDKESRKACEKQMLTFGAAKTHTPEMLPEALLENYSFANKENISKALRELLGLKGQKSFSSSMEESLNEYENVCHLRHCVVHRFGKLGVNNAIALGLEEHKHCIEKPLQLTFQTLQKISNLCMNVAKEINNYLWHKVITRLIMDSSNNRILTTTEWTWDFRADKRRFGEYFNLFVSQEAPPVEVSIKKAYDEYRNFYKTH